MKYIFLALFCVAHSALAVMNIGLCSDYLSRSVYKITPKYSIALRADQRMVFGTLGAYWETGFETIAFTVEPLDLIEKKVFKTPLFAVRFLKAGDYVYILDKTRTQILAEGYYEEVYETYKVAFGEIQKARPRLVSDKKEVLIDTEAYFDLIRNETEAAVVYKPQDFEIKYEEQLAQEIRAYEDRLAQERVKK